MITLPSTVEAVHVSNPIIDGECVPMPSGIALTAIGANLHQLLRILDLTKAGSGLLPT